MRAYRLTGWQQPAVLEEVPVPEAGPGQVLLEILACGACHSDLHLMEWPPETLPWQLPFTLGHEPVGRVAAVGPGVEGIDVGDVMLVYGPWGCGRCARCRLGMETYCERAQEIPYAGAGLGADGGMADYLLVPSPRFLVPIHDLDPVEAAPLTDAALTPYHAIKRSLPLQPGSSAVVIGIGGLGHMAVQILRELSPARIVAVDTDPEKLDLAKQVGAEVTVQAGDEALEQVREATRGRGAELVLDMVGADATLALAAGAARPLGDLAIVGLGGGTLPVSFFGIPYECSVATTYWGSVTELMEVVELAREGRIRAHVERFGLDDVAQVYERLRKGQVAGRAVVIP